jgi:hypothetical protein
MSAASWSLGHFNLGYDERSKLIDHQAFLSVVEEFPELKWAEDIDSEPYNQWVNHPERLKRTLFLNYDLSKTCPYELTFSFKFFDENQGLSIYIDMRSSKNTKVINLIFDFAEKLNVNVYRNGSKLDREKYLEKIAKK